MALINSAESQGFRFLFVSVPETDQHKKQKAGERKGGQANQNATNHSCLLPLASSLQSRFEKSSREKGLQPSSTLSPAACACLLLAAFLLIGGVHGALNVAITADYWSVVASTVERGRLMIHVFDVADQIADDF